MVEDFILVLGHVQIIPLGNTWIDVGPAPIHTTNVPEVEF